MTHFTGEEISELLNELSERLAAKAVEAEIYVLGGSAIAMAYDARRVTKDIDAIFMPVEAVKSVVEDMARERRIPKDWLNNAVAGTLHGVVADDRPKDLIRVGNVRVSVASPEYVLALKSMIRTRELDTDISDAALLCRSLGINSEEQLESLARRYFGDSALGSKELRFERIIDRAQAMTLLPVAPLRSMPQVSTNQSCGFWMKISKRSCSLRAGHAGQHR